MAAWVRARGYDYTRQRLGDTAGVATAMMLNILAATPTDARLTASRREQQLDYTVALVAFGAAVGMVIVGAIVYWPVWAPSIFATHPDSTPDGDETYAPAYPPAHPPRSAGDEPISLFRAKDKKEVGTKCTSCIKECGKHGRDGGGVLRDWKGGLGVGVGGRTSRQMGSQWISARISFLTNEQGALLGCKLLSSSSFSLKQLS